MNNKSRLLKSAYRLAVIAMHPTQYHCPLYRKLATSDIIQPTVLFLDKTGLTPKYDASINATIKWDIPLLGGYHHRFLANCSPCKTAFAINRINPQLMWQITNKKFDGILLQGYTSISYWMAIMAAKLNGLHVIFRGEAVIRQNTRSMLREKIKSITVKNIIKHSDTILYTCSGNKTFFEYYGCNPDKLYLFPCAVDNDYFRSQSDILDNSEQYLRKEMGINEDTFVILTVGRIDDRKRPQDLIMAANNLQKKKTDIAVVIVGDGPKRKECEKIAKDCSISKCFFVGFKNQSEISAYYHMADIFALCSSYDPSPKVINEALNFKLPIVCSDQVGTVGDTVIEGDNAFVFSTKNIDQITNAIEKLFDSGLRLKMGKRSLHISNQWSFEKDLECLENVIPTLPK